MNLEEKRKRLYDQVEASRKEIRADRMDMSFGEIMSFSLLMSQMINMVKRIPVATLHQCQILSCFPSMGVIWGFSKTMVPKKRECSVMNFR